MQKVNGDASFDHCSRTETYAPWLDDTVRDYLVQWLLPKENDEAGASVDDSEQSPSTLLDTLCHFLEGDESAATQIVQALIAAEAITVSERMNSSTETRNTEELQPMLLPQTTRMQSQEVVATLSSSEKTIIENDLHQGKPTERVPKVNRVAQRKAPRKEQQQQQLRVHDQKEDRQIVKLSKNSKASSLLLADTAEGTEDDSSAWQDCLAHDQLWGGRGRGGRGAYAGRVNDVRSNIHLTNVTVSLPNGTELLSAAGTTTMDIVRGHRYGLVGRNGVGKSTLLRRLAAKAIPGMPHTMRVLLVEQQQQQELLLPKNVRNGDDDGDDDDGQPCSSRTAVEALVQSDHYRSVLLRELEELEVRLQQEDDGVQAAKDWTETVERMTTVTAELDVIQADTAEQRAVEILQGLQFTDVMIYGPVAKLSGGWRMRLALAKALFVPGGTDLLCLDECTNHLDVGGLDWLIKYINSSTDLTIMVLSHDCYFLDAICTDIVVMEHQTKGYHVGNYSMYRQQQQEKAAREAQILDAAERQRTKAMAFVQKQQATAHKKSADPNKQRQAKMIREKKMDRIGNYREDGKRYKQRSLKTLDEKSVRLAQKVVIEVDEPVIKMYFPDPTWPPSVSLNDTIVRVENLSFGYETDKMILNDVTLSLRRGSKIALVGKNGCGKTSLVKLIAGEHTSGTTTKGDLWIHPNLRIGHVTQYTVEELEAYSDQTVVEYAEKQLRSGTASASIVAKASGNVRQYLGAFGLGGKLVLLPIGHLSGGERMRLCFATVLAENPGLLLLDESTNHVDIETLNSMSAALNAFTGSVLMVSHNQAFLSGFCQELWVLENGHVTVNYSSTSSFDEMFSQYRSNMLRNVGPSLTDRRRQEASLAKRATTQRAGVQQNTALL